MSYSTDYTDPSCGQQYFKGMHSSEGVKLI